MVDKEITHTIVDLFMKAVSCYNLQSILIIMIIASLS